MLYFMICYWHCMSTEIELYFLNADFRITKVSKSIHYMTLNKIYYLIIFTLA